MKEVIICILGVSIVCLSLAIMELEDRNKPTQEQNEILTIYCMALPACSKELEK